jgi:hypothetical protein
MNQNPQKKEFLNIFFEVLYIITFSFLIIFGFVLHHLFIIIHIKDNIFLPFKNLGFVHTNLNKKPWLRLLNLEFDTFGQVENLSFYRFFIINPHHVQV